MRRMITRLFIMISCGLFSAPRVMAQQPIPIWSLEPEMRIGSVDDGPYALTRISSIAVSPRTGAIFITQQDEVRVFDGDGRHLRTLGRRGDGPGEFRGLTRLNWSGELLAAFDSDLAMRATLMTEEGSVVESRAIFTASPGGSAARPRAALSGGYFLSEAVVSNEAFVSHEPLSAPLFRTDGNGNDQVLDQLSRSPGWRIYPFMGPQPLTGESLFAVDPGGREVAIVHQHPPAGAEDAWFRVRKLTASGQVLFARSYRFEPLLVPANFADSLLNSHASRIRSRVSIPRLEATLRATIRVPRYQPPVTNMVTAVDGSIWLRRESMGVDLVTWWVLSYAGDVVGQLRLPHRLSILHIDGATVWGVELDHLDVPYAVRYRVRR